MDLVQVKELVKLVVENKLDYIEVLGIKVQKSVHTQASVDDFKQVKLTPDQIKKAEDELLYFSSDSHV